MTGEEIVLGPLPKGITRAKEGTHKKVWNVLGHTYYMKAASESSFAFELSWSSQAAARRCSPRCRAGS